MSVNKVNSDGSLLRVAGGTLYADAPIGTISPFGGSTIPNGYLLCDGQAVSRTTYTELFATIGTAFGTGNGSTTFNVPDLRETAPVGVGENSTQTIAEHDTYTLGKFKDDQMQKINGTFRALSGNVSNPFYEKSVVSETYAGSSTSSRIIGFDTSRSARTGTTTHGKQLGVNYIIKAKQVAVPVDILAEINKVTTGTITRNASTTTDMNEAFASKVGRVAQIHANMIDCALIAGQRVIIATVSEDFKPLNQMWQLITLDFVTEGLRGWLMSNGKIEILSPITTTASIRFDVTYISLT